MNAMYLCLFEQEFDNECLCIIYMHMLHIPLFFFFFLTALYNRICDMILVFSVKIYFYMHVCINLSIICMYVSYYMRLTKSFFKMGLYQRPEKKKWFVARRNTGLELNIRTHYKISCIFFFSQLKFKIFLIVAKNKFNAEIDFQAVASYKALNCHYRGSQIRVCLRCFFFLGMLEKVVSFLPQDLVYLEFTLTFNIQQILLL